MSIQTFRCISTVRGQFGAASADQAFLTARRSKKDGHSMGFAHLRCCTFRPDRNLAIPNRVRSEKKQGKYKNSYHVHQFTTSRPIIAENVRECNFRMDTKPATTTALTCPKQSVGLPQRQAKRSRVYWMHTGLMSVMRIAS
jgi:hypothetical protein